MPVSAFSIIGDAIWIVAMSLIASGSQAFWRRLPGDVRVPLLGGWRAPRALAFGLMIGLPLAFGLALSAAARNPSNTPQDILLILLLRTFTGPVFVLAHHAWMRRAARTLEHEGALKP